MSAVMMPADAAGELRVALRRTPPMVPSKYFYDERGSDLFEQITELPEYYQTRTEMRILESCADAIAGLSPVQELIELGSGAGCKLRRLLDACHGPLRRCTQLDISPEALDSSIDKLRSWYPAIDFRGVTGDFRHDLPRLGRGPSRLVVFFGGTFGNLHPTEVPAFFTALNGTLGAGGRLLIGVDLVKDRRRLLAAYDDSAGVTAAFNRNMLHVLNRTFAGDFDPALFRHVVRYDEENAWIEMRLRAMRPCQVRLGTLDLQLTFREGDDLLTEISRKFTRESFGATLQRSGFQMDAWKTDPESLFALVACSPRTRTTG